MKREGKKENEREVKEIELIKKTLQSRKQNSRSQKELVNSMNNGKEEKEVFFGTYMVV